MNKPKTINIDVHNMDDLLSALQSLTRVQQGIVVTALLENLGLNLQAGDRTSSLAYRLGMAVYHADCFAL